MSDALHKKIMALAGRALGWIVLSGSIYYLGLMFWQNWQDVRAQRFAFDELGVMALAVLAYGWLMFLLTAAWSVILASVMGRWPDPVAAVNVHCRSMIAKYLPGNVFQYVTRQVLGRQNGWPQVAIALTSLVDAVMMFAGVGLVTAIIGLIAKTATPVGPSHTLIWIAFLVALAPWLVIGLAGYLPWLRTRFTLQDVQRVMRSRKLVLSLALYIAFFIGHGLAVWMVYSELAYHPPVDILPEVVFGYSAAWIVGFLAPGSPGGLGVREAMIVLLLQHKIGHAQALSLAVAARVMTSGGDLVHFVTGMALVRARRRELVAATTAQI